MFCSIICTHNWLICIIKLLTYKLHIFICSCRAVRKICFPNFKLVTVYKLARNRKSHRQGVSSLLPKDTFVHELSLLHNAFLELHAEEEFVPNSISLGEENNLLKNTYCSQSHIVLSELLSDIHNSPCRKHPFRINELPYIDICEFCTQTFKTSKSRMYK